MFEPPPKLCKHAKPSLPDFPDFKLLLGRPQSGNVWPVSGSEYCFGVSFGLKPTASGLTQPDAPRPLLRAAGSLHEPPDPHGLPGGRALREKRTRSPQEKCAFRG